MNFAAARVRVCAPHLDPSQPHFAASTHALSKKRSRGCARKIARSSIRFSAWQEFHRCARRVVPQQQSQGARVRMVLQGRALAPTPRSACPPINRAGLNAAPTRTKSLRAQRAIHASRIRMPRVWPARRCAAARGSKSAARSKSRTHAPHAASAKRTRKHFLRRASSSYVDSCAADNTNSAQHTLL